MRTISVFEHQSLRLGEYGVTETELLALQRFHSDTNFPYYRLIHQGVRFNEYVGVLQVGKTRIEILPKADNVDGTETWRRRLIDMIRSSGLVQVSAPTTSSLSLRRNAILDLYVERFVTELEYLLHRGLAKRYRKTHGNVTSQRGRIVFSKHIRMNSIHQERVYVEYTEFSKDHLLHQVLYKCLRMLTHLVLEPDLIARVHALLLRYPEQDDVKVSESTFTRIQLNRSTQHYESALSVARLLLLSYHPDVSRGTNSVLALMFDMNMLWERFVYMSLKKHLPAGTEVRAQLSKEYWRREGGMKTSIRPDIIVWSGTRSFVIDTKWKNISSAGISSSDLHQMYVYLEYFRAQKAALVFPGTKSALDRGAYIMPYKSESWSKECALIPIAAGGVDDVSLWQREIAASVSTWMAL